MIPKVKGLSSNDLPDAKAVPTDPSDCAVLMQAEIGPVGDEGADTFYFEVATPNALAQRFDDGERPFWIRGTLLVSTFSWEAVEAALDQLVSSTDGHSWAEVGAKLNLFLRWEFDPSYWENSA